MTIQGHAALATQGAITHPRTRGGWQDQLTGKVLNELAALDLGLGPEDVREVLCTLTPRDSSCRLRSESTAEWMYVWKPEICEMIVYVKVILRSDCVVVSFHEDEGDGHEEVR
jgi:hypothetical protein